MHGTGIDNIFATACRQGGWRSFAMPAMACMAAASLVMMFLVHIHY
jgi:hypothetical protein